MWRSICFGILLLCFMSFHTEGQRQRLRAYGIAPGVMKTGPLNAITDVPGVQVGHTTLIEGDHIRTGVTAILPHEGNIFLNKLPAAIHVGNGFGKLAGSTQVVELGNIESPIVLTNTLSVGTAISATVEYMLALPGMEQIRSVNAVVGETNDGALNDIRGMHVTKEHVWEALTSAKGGAVAEGNVGAGTGTVAFGWKGGIGTSSRVLPEAQGGYTVGVLVQSNFGGVFTLDGVPVDKELNRHMMRNAYGSADGSCMIVVITDAPLDSRNLQRLASRAMLGLAKTGGIASNGSGDYAIALSNHPSVKIPHQHPDRTNPPAAYLRNDHMSSLFLAAIEATEEAILNSLFMAEDMTANGRTIKAMPIPEVLELVKKYRPGN